MPSRTISAIDNASPKRETNFKNAVKSCSALARMLSQLRICACTMLFPPSSSVTCAQSTVQAIIQEHVTRHFQWRDGV
jgi:hypothetical protein